MEPPDATQTTKDYVSARNTTTYAFVAERSKAVHSSCTVFVHASSNLVECTSFAPLSYVRATHLLILRRNNHTFADSSGKRDAMPYMIIAQQHHGQWLLQSLELFLLSLFSLSQESKHSHHVVIIIIISNSHVSSTQKQPTIYRQQRPTTGNRQSPGTFAHAVVRRL